MKVLQKALIAGGVALAVLVPVTTALASDDTTPMTTRGNGECTQDMERLRLRDGTGWRHGEDGAVVNGGGYGHGYGYRTGPMDGSGPQADRPLDGTGNQVRAGR